MKIENIKKKNNKYIIKLGEKEIITYDEVIIKNNILYKKEIDEKLLKEIEEENKYYEYYEKILKYIKNKIKSKNEIIKYMEKQDINKITQEKILKQLEQSKIIDDRIYTKAYIHDKITFKNYGTEKIKNELLKQNIAESIISEELKKIDQRETYEKLEKMIIKKINSNTKYSENMLKNKLQNYFISLGYKKEEIIEIIEKNMVNNNQIIKKEYEKLYNKLKTKYNEEELKIKIKQKLYQKGFSIEEINNIN